MGFQLQLAALIQGEEIGRRDHDRPDASRSQKQKAAFTAAMPEPLSVRRDRIDRAIALLIDHKDEFAKAVSADFGHRSTEQTLMTDIMPSVSAMKHAKKHFESWATR